jgi:hypothetical protein
MNVSFEKLTQLLEFSYSELNQKTNPETKPTIGLDDGQLVLWVVYRDKFWVITLDDFDFDNIPTEIIKNRDEIIEWMSTHPEEV